MNITKYQELTGLTIPTSQQAYVTAQIKRTQRVLESMLGYTLDKSKSQTNYYTEAGKSPTELVLPANDDNLVAADDVVNAYRLYPYHKDDPFILVDPFRTLNVVKLVYMRQGEDGDGVTLKTFDSDEISIQVGKEGLSKYLKRCQDCIWECVCECQDCVQLAVDADWLYDGCLPADLEYIWADMVTAYSDSKYDIKSETLGSHSYTRFDGTYPEDDVANLSVIKSYAGPYGSVKRTITL